MVCQRCKSNNVLVTTEQISGVSATKKYGILWSLGRLILIVGTCGLWLIFGKKKETSKTKFKYQTVAICQDCGYKHTV